MESTRNCGHVVRDKLCCSLDREFMSLEITGVLGRRRQCRGLMLLVFAAARRNLSRDICPQSTALLYFSFCSCGHRFAFLIRDSLKKTLSYVGMWPKEVHGAAFSGTFVYIGDSEKTRGGEWQFSWCKLYWFFLYGIKVTQIN